MQSDPFEPEHTHSTKTNKTEAGASKLMSLASWAIPVSGYTLVHDIHTVQYCTADRHVSLPDQKLKLASVPQIPLKSIHLYIPTSHYELRHFVKCFKRKLGRPREFEVAVVLHIDRYSFEEPYGEYSMTDIWNFSRFEWD